MEFPYDSEKISQQVKKASDPYHQLQHHHLQRKQSVSDETEENSDSDGSPSQNLLDTSTHSVQSLNPQSSPDLLINERKRGSGIEYFMQQLHNRQNDKEDSECVTTVPSSSLSAKTKNILFDLATENNIDVSPPSKSWLLQQQRRKRRKPIESSMSDERVMQLAQEGELSFLASLLKVIEEEGGSVTTKFLIKACCLAVEPARVPSLCDAKEMVMSALHYLTQSFDPSCDIYPVLPLIRCIQENPDLEKRSYEKYRDWTIRDSFFLEQVLQLEQVFYNSIDYKYLAREHMCPILPTGRDLLLLKGSPPPYCMGKIKKAAPPKRK